jgi:hypothetical protein
MMPFPGTVHLYRSVKNKGDGGTYFYSLRPLFASSSPRGPGNAPAWLRVIQRLAVSEGLILTTRSRHLSFGTGLSNDARHYPKAEVLRMLRRSD